MTTRREIDAQIENYRKQLDELRQTVESCVQALEDEDIEDWKRTYLENDLKESRGEIERIEGEIKSLQAEKAKATE